MRVSSVAILIEWLADDGADVRRGEPVCVVHTTKAPSSSRPPSDGTRLYLDDTGLLARALYGGGGVVVVLDSVHDFCRKRGITLSPARGVAPAT